MNSNSFRDFGLRAWLCALYSITWRSVAKGRVLRLFLLPALVAGPALMLALGARAQSIKALHNFNRNSDGAEPQSGLALIGNTLYGTTHYGGIWNGFGSDFGTVFALSTDGTGFRVVFTFPPGDLGVQTGNPEGKFVISDGTLYGTGYQYYDYPNYPWYGFIFSASIDGTSQFLNNWFELEPMFGDGSQPDGVIQSESLLYGVTRAGGQFGHGTVYMFDGSTITNLYCFAGGDGATPNGGLILSNDTLYGVTRAGGSWGNGTVYALDSVGTGLRTLHHFTGSTNGEGANPMAGLILSGNTLFGTTFAGGTSDRGTVFRVAIDGTGFTTLHSFTAGEGANPSAALSLSGNTLYGTTFGGGNSNSGTVFSVTIDDGAFRTLHSFSGPDGAFPIAELLVSGNTLFGTTELGGNRGQGTVFSLSLPVASPQLTITPSGLNVVLTWPTNGTFFLQSTPSLVSPPVWTRVSSSAIVVNGQNTMTNPISGTQQFFRLSQ